MDYSKRDPQVFYDSELEKFIEKNPSGNELDFIRQNLIPYVDLKKLYESDKLQPEFQDEKYLGYIFNYVNFFKTKEKIYLLEEQIKNFSINKSDNSNFENQKFLSAKKINKSSIFQGKELNLLERFKIANSVLDIDKKIRTLNIQELKKYELLAYILGCDKDNARNLMNGTYNAKCRDLSNYLKELD
jgi:hypothetical protein